MSSLTSRAGGPHIFETYQQFSLSYVFPKFGDAVVRVEPTLTKVLPVH